MGDTLKHEVHVRLDELYFYIVVQVIRKLKTTTTTTTYKYMFLLVVPEKMCDAIRCLLYGASCSCQKLLSSWGGLCNLRTMFQVCPDSKRGGHSVRGVLSLRLPRGGHPPHLL